jgi:cytochrome c peroxidase
MTPPYFHDGAVATLPEAVRIMAKVQLDKDLSEPELDQIVAFLGSLTGTLPEGFERAPVLPAAGFGPPSPASGSGGTRSGPTSWRETSSRFSPRTRRRTAAVLC